MISPSSGDAHIQEHSIKQEIDTIRQSLAYCPQYDIIYRDMSVKEHMKFYGWLRSIDQEEVRSEERSR